jgi:ATP-dependent DNA helicase RecG
MKSDSGKFDYTKTPHSSKEIIDQIQIKDRSYFRRHYLEPMIKAEQLKMTTPEKPKSRNQKYYTE